LTFSLVVVLHDSAGPLPALLRSLALLPAPPQLVVVDTGSRDDGPALAGAAGAEVVELGANPGFGAANNAGVDRARHAVTVLLNPDCELLDSSLARLAAAAAARPDRLWVPRLLEADGAVQRSAHPRPGTVGALLAAVTHAPALPRELRERAEPFRAERARTVGWAIAACVAARTETLRGLGPFDPRQFLFFEDMDLCLRARAAGIPTVLDPSVRIRHLGGHATRRAYPGEPHELLARRRREVVLANRGRAALALDDAAQALTFASRVLARRVAGREAERARAQLAALRLAIGTPGAQ
jgi:N-acetylglucosaminyl-diphospho-decaprenol L-rhamnosyltransferase